MLRRDVALHPFVSLRVGGPAQFLAEPAGANALGSLLRWARQNDCPCVILGAGSNVVFPDSGFTGLVIRMTGLRGRLVEGTHIHVAAGERLAEVAWWAARRGLSGIEWACGIPGSVGGAVVMNAGTRDGDMADVLISVEALGDQRSIEKLPAESLRLGYRTSAILTGDLRRVIVGATFALQRDDPARCLERARTTIEERLRRLPVGASAGCIFRNPASGPTAGEFLDRAGCKGMSVGQARVSTKHANVIVNEGVDNAGDVIALIERMQRRVLETFGVELCQEVVIYS